MATTQTAFPYQCKALEIQPGWIVELTAYQMTVRFTVGTCEEDAGRIFLTTSVGFELPPVPVTHEVTVLAHPRPRRTAHTP